MLHVSQFAQPLNSVLILYLSFGFKLSAHFLTTVLTRKVLAINRTIAAFASSSIRIHTISIYPPTTLFMGIPITPLNR